MPVKTIDIKKVSNIWFMFVEDSERQKSKLRVLLEKCLFTPNLFNWDSLTMFPNSRDQKERLFWELKEEKMGMLLRFQDTSMISSGCRSMGEIYKVLYCTRHTFINKLYSEKVDENVIESHWS